MAERDDIVLRIEGLTKRYGAFTALDNLNLTVQKGEVLGYLGPNGAGKTTTIRLLLGLIKPSQGSATIFGLDSQRDRVEAHRRLAYVPGEATLWPQLTGAETLHLLGRIHGQTDLTYQKELVGRFQLDANKKVRTYSKGNKQKINLIAALASRAELLVLDEPTAGLDPIMEQTFRECVAEARQNGQTIFLSTLAEMRHLSAVTVTATFDHEPPKVGHVKGVSGIHVSGHELTCQIHGPIDELLHVLAAAKPKTLLSREPSLEELFLSLYGDEAANRGR
jgi:ABC-2 type transport system ATP-binding protein